MKHGGGKRALVGIAVGLIAVAGCKKSSQNGTPTPTASGSATILATVSASATVMAPPARPTKAPSARVCHVGPAAIASEGRGANTFAVAASAAGVLVTWGEARAATAGFGPSDAKQRFEMARLFEAPPVGAAPAPPTAKGPAKEIGRQEAVDAFSNGIAPFALADGTLGTGTCAWAAFAGKLSCSLQGLVAPPTAGKFAGSAYDDPGVAGPGPEGDRVAAAGIGDAAVMLLPQCQEVRMISSAGKAGVRPLAYGSADALSDCDPKRKLDVPALAALGASEGAAVWRHGNVIEGRLVGGDGMPHAGIVTVSDGKGDVGAPAIVGTDGEARVVYAERTGSAPWVFVSAHWKAGAPVVRAPLVTGTEPAMAPALAATDDATCVLVSWTEGKGSATRVRAGLACGDALVSASVVDVSHAGIEAGDSELARVATDASGAWIVWQELPKGKPAELEVARITCE